MLQEWVPAALLQAAPQLAAARADVYDRGWAHGHNDFHVACDGGGTEGLLQVGALTDWLLAPPQLPAAQADGGG